MPTIITPPMIGSPFRLDLGSPSSDQFPYEGWTSSPTSPLLSPALKSAKNIYRENAHCYIGIDSTSFAVSGLRARGPVSCFFPRSSLKGRADFPTFPSSATGAHRKNGAELQMAKAAK